MTRRGRQVKPGSLQTGRLEGGTDDVTSKMTAICRACGLEREERGSNSYLRGEGSMNTGYLADADADSDGTVA